MAEPDTHFQSTLSIPTLSARNERADYLGPQDRNAVTWSQLVEPEVLFCFALFFSSLSYFSMATLK